MNAELEHVLPRLTGVPLTRGAFTHRRWYSATAIDFPGDGCIRGTIHPLLTRSPMTLSELGRPANLPIFTGTCCFVILLLVTASSAQGQATTQPATGPASTAPATQATASTPDLPPKAVLVQGFSISEKSDRDPDQKVASGGNFNQRNDNMGFQWDFRPSGVVNDGTNDAFDGGFELQISYQGANVTFNAPAQQQTADGQELVLTQQLPQDMVMTRRVWLDAERALVRYLEVVTNNSKKKQTVTLSINTVLGGNASSTMTADGRTVPASGSKFTIEKDDLGIATVPNGRPSIIHLLAGPRSKVRPTVTNQTHRRYQVAYTFDVPPGKTVSILHMVAQRHSINASDPSLIFEEMFDKQVRQPNVPKELLPTLINFKVAASVQGEALLAGLTSLAEDAGVGELEPGAAALVLGDSTLLMGTMDARAVTLESSGTTHSFAWKTIAALQSLSPERQRVHLRDGRIIAGKMSFDGMTFQAKGGLNVDLSPTSLSLIVNGPSELDNRPPQAAAMLLTTVDGLRFASRDTEEPIRLVTSWGRFEFRMSRVLSIQKIQGMVGGHAVMLDDGTSVTGVLAGDPVTFESAMPASSGSQVETFQVDPKNIQRLARLRTVPEDPAAIEKLVEKLSMQAERIAQRSHLVLSGDNRLVGAVDLESLSILNASGRTVLPVSQIREITWEDGDRTSAIYTLTTMGGGTLTGRIEQRMLPLKGRYRDWLVPTEHVVTAVLSVQGDTP